MQPPAKLKHRETQNQAQTLICHREREQRNRETGYVRISRLYQT